MVRYICIVTIRYVDAGFLRSQEVTNKFVHGLTRVADSR